MEGPPLACRTETFETRHGSNVGTLSCKCVERDFVEGSRSSSNHVVNKHARSLPAHSMYACLRLFKCAGHSTERGEHAHVSDIEIESCAAGNQARPCSLLSPSPRKTRSPMALHEYRSGSRLPGLLGSACNSPASVSRQTSRIALEFSADSTWAIMQHPQLRNVSAARSNQPEDSVSSMYFSTSSVERAVAVGAVCFTTNSIPPLSLTIRT